MGRWWGRRVRTGTVLQIEQQDCGPACLAMVLRHFGRHVPLHELSEVCGVSRDGVDAATLLRVAREYGLTAGGRRVTLVVGSPGGFPGPLRDLPLPAIVLTRGAHFSLLERVGREQVTLNDPARGRYVVSAAEFLARFSGIALVFERGQEFRAGGDRWLAWRGLGRRLRPYRRGIGYVALTGLAATVPAVGVSLAAKVFAQLVLLQGARVWIPTLILAGCGAAALAAAATWLQQRAIGRLQTAMALTSSARFIWAMLRLPPAFFQRRHVGALVSRVQANDAVALLLSSRLVTAVVALTVMAVYLAALVSLAPVLAAVAVCFAVLNGIVLAAAGRVRATHAVQRAWAEQRRDSTAFGGVSTIENVKADGAEAVLFTRFAAYQARALNATQRLEESSQALLALPVAVNQLATVTIALAGAVAVLHGALGLGTYVAVLTLSGSFLAPVGGLIGVLADAQAAKGRLTLLEDVLVAEPAPGWTPVTDPECDGGDRPGGAVELREVCFGYAPGRPPLIDNLSLTVAPGERVVVVGASGAGKSTVAQLLVGLLEPWSGTVALSGVSRAELPRGVSTAAIGYVAQRTHLFAGTIRDNVAFWDERLPVERLRAALADACLTEVVARRGGIDGGRVAEAGRNFSGGERQRLELARALAEDPAVLVLDEATSALDPETEARVEANLRRRGVTQIVFAHRLSTVRTGDRVVVLDQGRIVQQGSHRELLATAGSYRELFRAGTREVSS